MFQEKPSATTVEAPINTAPTHFTPLPDTKQPGEHYVPLPNGSQDGWTSAHARQTILVEPQALYELWSDVSKFPLWQEHVVSVTPQPEKSSHWVMGDPDDPDGKRIEFDSRIVEDIPGRKLAWETISGDIEQKAEVEFKARRDGRGTVVTLIQNFKVSGFSNAIVGRSGAAHRDHCKHGMSP